MKKSFFISTKPLQYVNCTNIDDGNLRVCFLCRSFSDADYFFRVAKRYSTYFSEFKIFDSKSTALIYSIFHQRQCDKLYIDSDYGLLVRFLLLFFITTKVYTYEEGYASYSYLRTENSILNKLILKITDYLKIQNWSGGSCKVSGTYLYDHSFFCEKIELPDYNFLRKFNLSFYECVLASPELSHISQEIDFGEFSNRDILIYLSGWSIYPHIDKLLYEYPLHYKLMKLHPNILSHDDKLDELFDYIIPSNLIFEYFLFKLVRVSKSVHIIHHGSFALHYLKRYDFKQITQTVL